MRIETYSIKNVLYSEGEAVNDVFFIKEGEIELSKALRVEDAARNDVSPAAAAAGNFISEEGLDDSFELFS